MEIEIAKKLIHERFARLDADKRFQYRDRFRVPLVRDQCRGLLEIFCDVWCGSGHGFVQRDTFIIDEIMEMKSGTHKRFTKP